MRVRRTSRAFSRFTQAKRNSKRASISLTSAMHGKDRQRQSASPASEMFPATLALWALTELPAMASADAPFGAPPAQSYYVSLGLFVMTVPGKFLPAQSSSP